MKHVNSVIFVFLALLFLFAGLDKAFHYRGFYHALQNYVLLPKGAAIHVAFPIIGLEVLIGIGLLLRPWRRTAALTAAITLAAFTTALGVNYVYGDRGLCGCWFSVTLAQGAGSHMISNLILAALALFVWAEGPGDRVPGVPAPGPAMAP